MQPDTTVLEEIKGAECRDIIMASHGTWYSTLQASSPYEALNILNQLSQTHSSPLPIAVSRRYLSRRLGLIVHIGRLNDGS